MLSLVEYTSGSRRAQKRDFGCYKSGIMKNIYLGTTKNEKANKNGRKNEICQAINIGKY